ncbi:6-bladed beta-propeller [Belliella kenyensis]|uniref:6-bladed beta-propeller n=1 Tax=Belliella kenyensis TaxID=1472724 RepID=A0ABV8ELZ2_9BACT|nr:6-bladed beta-propeller [Belliella kenyensis]MCH7403784.1 6-bladed beta-propeller [Belliella kenyensis]MDN3602432.1 6-bladed beta-propeller [Belliella kenyensis]
MKIKHCIITLFNLLVFFSCTNKKYIETDSIIVHFKQKVDTLNISSLFSEMKTIPLSNEITIGEIERLIIDNNNNLYILDSHLSGTISKYSLNGDLISYINIENDARFDLNGITDMYFDSPHLKLNVLGQRIIKLDTNLNVIDRINLPYKSNSHLKLNDNYIMFNNFLEDKVQYDYYVFNQNNSKISNKFLEFSNEYPFHYKANAVFQYNNNYYHFSKAFNDTIYRIDEQLRLNPYITVDFSNHKLPKNSLNKINNALEMYQFLKQTDFSTLMGEIHFVKDDLLISTAHSEGKTQNILINVSSREAKIFSHFKDDLISEANFYNILYSDERYLVFTLSAELLYDQLVDTDNKFLKDFKLTPNQNPYLFLIKK